MSRISEVDAPVSTQRTFLTPRHDSASSQANVPTLDEFDAEIDIYRVRRIEEFCLSTQYREMIVKISFD